MFILLLSADLHAKDNSEIVNMYHESVDQKKFIQTLSYEDCINLIQEISGTSSLWKMCVSIDTEKHDKKLNESYKSLIKTNKDLQNIQRAWIKYRDLKCNFSMTAGASGMGAYLCLREETKRRSEELLSLIDVNYN
jgi:uncharacterized protein YecT (DUF1311 family)